MKSTNMKYLSLAGLYARSESGCTKVSVGSIIVDGKGEVLSFGANRVLGNWCKNDGCLRIAKYGDNAKTHRNPDDCLAIHSEIDAICDAARKGMSVAGATIYVTRYPCENCARAIAASGIKHVVFGRNQPISEQTKAMFDEAGVTYHNETNYMEDDTVV